MDRLFDGVFPVVIIGASVAGAQTALALAEHGISSALFERATFPRAKACGEGLSRIGLQYVERHLHGCDFASFFGYQIGDIKITASERRGIGIARSILDMQIVKALNRYPQVKCFFGESPIIIERSEDGWLLSSKQRRINARFLVAADGAISRTASLIGAKSRSVRTTRVSLTYSAQVVSGDTPALVSILPQDGGEIYLTPLGRGMLNVSVVGSPKFLQKDLEIEKLVELACGLRITLGDRAIGAGHFGTKRVPAGDGYFLVGDACETFDPACGFGISHALITGNECASLISHVLNGKITEAEACTKFIRFHRPLSRAVRLLSHAIRALFYMQRNFPRVLNSVSCRFISRLLAGYEKHFLYRLSKI